MAKRKNKNALNDILNMYRPTNTDPQGSWTGVPKDKYDIPVQDADDL